MNLHQDDARLAALRTMYPNPQPQIETRFSVPNQPVSMRHFVFRNGPDPAGPVSAVDSLFPAVLEGRADMSGLDENSADLLYGLIRGLQPRVVLETGTHKGRSTRAIATALRDNAEVLLAPHCFTMTFAPGHLYTVDAEDHRIFDLAIPESAKSYVTAITGWTPDVFQAAPLDTLAGIDFAFLDGDHTAEGLDAELQYVDAHRAAECWVAIDNSRDAAWPGVARTLREFTKYPRVSLATCTGLDLIWMSGTRSPREETAKGGARAR